MANMTATTYTPGDGVRKVQHSEQALLTSAGAVTTYRLTLLGRVTSGGKYCPYASNDSPTGANIPVAISLSEVVSDGAGDDVCGILLAGEVEESKIRIHGGTVGANITEAIKDQLRTMGIIVTDSVDCNVLDNNS